MQRSARVRPLASLRKHPVFSLMKQWKHWVIRSFPNGGGGN